MATVEGRCMRLKSTIKRLFLFLGLEYRWLALPMFRYNIYSQNGEDGVIEFILRKLPTIPPFVIDIGANDGVEASNSRLLIGKYGFHALLIEPYEQAFLKLEALYGNHHGVTLNKIAVGPSDQETGIINWHGHFQDLTTKMQNVNAAFEQTAVPPDIGFLSIDIDGHDNEVLQSIHWKRFRPWVVISEIDSSSHVKLQTQIDIMDQAGYHPILHIGNVFYVRKDLAGSYFFNWKTTTSNQFGLFRKQRV